MTPLNNLAKSLSVGVLCLVFSSCGDRKAPPDAPGNSPTYQAIHNSDPVGTWKVDGAATLAANQAYISRQLEEIPKGNQAEAREKLERIFRTIEGTMEFKPDNSFVRNMVFSGEETSMRGTWDIDAGKIIIRPDGFDGEQLLTATIEEELLTLMSSGDHCVVLRRE